MEILFVALVRPLRQACKGNRDRQGRRLAPTTVIPGTVEEARGGLFRFLSRKPLAFSGRAGAGSSSMGAATATGAGGDMGGSWCLGMASVGPGTKCGLMKRGAMPEPSTAHGAPATAPFPPPVEKKIRMDPPQQPAKLDPGLPRIVDSIDVADGDRVRIEQAYRFVVDQLHRDPERLLRYDLNVAPFLDGTGTYRDFLAASEVHRTLLPQGEKPAVRGDRRRKRALPCIETTWQTCASCGAILSDEYTEGEDFVCDCGLILREEENYGIGYKEREHYEVGTKRILPAEPDPPRRTRPSSSQYRSNSVYKRANHLNELLLQLQGLERTIVPSEVIDKVKAEAAKYRIETTKITMAQVRSILQRLKKPKMYEHAAQIVHTLTGKPPIVIPEDVEVRLKTMFQELLPVYEEYKGKRKNFLSYTFAIFKLLEIIGEEELVQHGRQMKLLKSKSKIKEQDAIWRNICQELEWPFFESKV